MALKFEHDGQAYTTKDVINSSGCAANTAQFRIHRFLDGKITFEELMEPVRARGERKIKVSVYKVGDREMTTRQLAREIKSTIDTARTRLRRYKNGKITAVQVLKEVVQRNSKEELEKVYQRGRLKYTILDLQAATDLSTPSAKKRLERWATGEYATENLFKAQNFYQESNPTEEYKSLGNKERNLHLLRKFQPTTFDERYSNHYSSGDRCVI